MKRITGVTAELSTPRRTRPRHHALTIETTKTKGMEIIGRNRLSSPTATATDKTTIQGTVVYPLEPPKQSPIMATMEMTIDTYLSMQIMTKKTLT